MKTRRLGSLHLVVAVGFAAMAIGSITLNLNAARDLQRADTAVGRSSDALTALANLSRHSLLLVQDAHHVNSPDDVEDLYQMRQTLERHLRVVGAAIGPEHPERAKFDEITNGLAVADRDLARLRDATPATFGADRARAVASLRRAELATKRLYDRGESIYLGTLRSTLDAGRGSRRALAVTGVLTAVLGTVLLVAMRRAADSEVRTAYAQLMRETKERAVAEEALHRAERRFVQNVLHASETERTRLAMELHDGPIQALTAIGYLIDVELMKSSEPLPWLDAVRERLSDEVGGLRRIMAELRPPGLDAGGLCGALRDYVAGFARDTGIPADLDSDIGATRLDERVETVAYRIVQEALQNVRKHAKASRVAVVVRLSAEQLAVRVTDDGVGFTPELTDGGSDHFGMATMSERATTVGGVLDVVSEPGQGTTVSAVLPRTVMEEAA